MGYYPKKKKCYGEAYLRTQMLSSEAKMQKHGIAESDFLFDFEDKCGEYDEPSPIVEEKSPIVEEKSPIVEEKSPIVEETSPIVEETSPNAEETSPSSDAPVAGTGLDTMVNFDSEWLYVITLCVLAGFVGAYFGKQRKSQFYTIQDSTQLLKYESFN